MNPFARKVAEFATEGHAPGVLAALVLRARAGDAAAARLFLPYTVGKPGPAADPDTLDAHEPEVRWQNVASGEDTRAMLPVPASVMCVVVLAAARPNDARRDIAPAFAGRTNPRRRPSPRHP